MRNRSATRPSWARSVNSPTVVSTASSNPATPVVKSTTDTDPIDLLSSRAREILQMLAEGKTNKEVAQVLNISVYTVDAHRGRIMEKLNLHSIGEMVRFAMRNGLID